MKIINKLSREHYTLIEKLLAQGKIISFPTETVYALSCDATNEAVINKIYQLKQRASNQVFAIFVADVEALAERMIWFVENQEQLDTMGKKSRELAENLFDVHQVNNELMKIMNL